MLDQQPTRTFGLTLSFVFVLTTCVEAQSTLPDPASAPDDAARFAKLDLNGDELLTGKEAKSVAVYFDVDRDGQVTKPEYLNVRDAERRFVEWARDDRETEEAFAAQDATQDNVLSGKEIGDFAAYDLDGDGRIHRYEFSAARAEALKQPGFRESDFRRRAETDFTALDGNEDGRLSGKEIGAEHKAFDADGDDRISQAEFIAGAERQATGGDAANDAKLVVEDEQRFKELDANEDDRLSGTELAAARDFDADGNGRVTKDEFLAGRKKERQPKASGGAAGIGKSGKFWNVYIGVSNYRDQPLNAGTPDAYLLQSMIANLPYTNENRDAKMSADSLDESSRPNKSLLSNFTASHLKQPAADDLLIYCLSARAFAIGERAFICPLDFDPQRALQTGWPAEELRDALEACPARRKVLILDCRQFDGVGDEPLLGPTEKLAAVFQPVKGLTTWLSHREGEVSLQSKEAAEGVFFQAVVAAMSGGADYDSDGFIDNDELYAYLLLSVPYAAQGVPDGGAQTPLRVVGTETTGTFDIVRWKAPPKAEGIADDGGGTNKEFTNSIGMKFVLVPAGDFTMGSPDDEYRRRLDETPVLVGFKKPFYLGVYEVTQEEFDTIRTIYLEENELSESIFSEHRYLPSYYSRYGSGANEVREINTRRLPKDSVSWNDANRYCKWLSEHRKESAAGRSYRLPTEAEWEYACRAGTDTAFAFGPGLSSTSANIRGQLEGNEPYLARTAIVGSYTSNRFGLFDMHGNVAEWCQDFYYAYPLSFDARNLDLAVENRPGRGTVFLDPAGPKTGHTHVVRGGDFSGDASMCRSAARRHFDPEYRSRFIGIRLVCVFGKKPEVSQPDQR